MHPEQDPSGTQHCQARHQKTADGGTQKLVYGIQIGNKVTADSARAASFVLGHGHPLQTPEQAGPDAEHHILGNLGKFPGLQNVKRQCRHTKQKCHHNHQADIDHRCFPAPRQEGIHYR